MSITQEDLQKYMDDPKSVPHDVLLKLAQEDSGQEPEPVETPPAVDDAKQDGKPEEIPAEPSDSSLAAPSTEQELVAPIMSKDGQRVYPYDALRVERIKRQAAESQIAEAQAKIDALTQQIESGQVPAPAIQEQPAISEEELAALREDFPAFAKVLESQMAQTAKLEARLAELGNVEAQREARERESSAATVQDLIDANPKLLHLQTNDPKGWAKAIALDNAIKEDPDMAHLTMAQRFDKVVSAYEALHGVINSPAPQTETPVQDPKTAKAAAEKVVKAVKPSVPKSLSDLPGGVPVEATEKEKLENMSAAQIGAMFNKMTEEQRNAYLNGL